MSVDAKQAVIPIDGGEFVVTWPPTITSAEYEDIVCALKLLERHLKRCVQVAGPHDGNEE